MQPIKQITILLFTIIIFFSPVLSRAAEQESTTRARKILEEIDDLWRSTSSHSILTMHVKTEHYTRTLRMEHWSKGKDKSLVRIISPLKEKGTATLKSGNTIYTYLPKTDRTIRLTSSMMMGSWMGSHFTNDDLVKESRLSEDYDPRISFEGERNDQDIIEFTLIPKPDAPVVWGKIVTTVTSDNHLPITSLYYDEDMDLMRTLTFNEVKEMDGRLLPTVLRVEPEDKKGEYTELIYEKIEFGVELPDSFFSILQLRR